MSVVTVGDNIPQWKKDLIARLKHQNKKVAAIVLNGDEHQQQYSNSTVQQPKPKSEPAPVGSSAPRQTVAKRGHVNNNCTGWSSEQRAEIMVQQDHRNHEHLVDMVSNGYVKDHGGDSDSEDLHYGPGIVKKLKNKYLSLALREAVTRPSILQLRKATSLENLLDEDTRQGNNKLFQSKLNGNDTR
ncbi:unnamed protein product [Phaedon cochleariae]|uniref:Uncharacterized protein n=1 Tax=Phaedon cochleariae TaxID=80249 RepID=A0A9N9SIL2_PHACE|nr:unnamed protein product [Phaedon cochleariae]